ncbi:CrcB-like protein [Mycolicibacterium chubuense NBB4]|uniref:CrcB-like protein n=1 Tax=Mycolicibacterium chubuense (strain NBB4) TaxID=710421 RepID=I4BFR8_MYCCN|nr:chromosome condensation protein CrcB [Mycolicibacterium chubuense]AFM16125.1 CrcB-like protein [Mycolicibacterium chubuense NBB4]
MPGRHRASRAQPVAVIVGGAAGAVLRYAIAATWPLPRQVLMSTVLTAAIAFLIAGFLIANASTSTPRAAILGMCASAASLSAYALFTISQTPKLSIASLVLTPAAAIGGLLCGLLIARVAAQC